MVTKVGILCLIIHVIVIEGNLGDKFYLLKIRIREGSAEGDHSQSNVKTINNILKLATGVDVKVSIKELGSPVILAVINIKQDCLWTQITNKLSMQGYEFSSIPVLSCSDFAYQFKFTMPRVRGVNITNYLHFTFPFFGRNETSFLDEMGSFIEMYSIWTMQHDWTLTCFSDIVGIPIQMFFFNDMPEHAWYQFVKEMGDGVKFNVKIRKGHDLNKFVSCFS